MSNCNCRKKPVIIHGIQNPTDRLDVSSFKLIKPHPDNGRKFFYTCTECGQTWEKLTHPHTYGYTETWKKLERIPEITPKEAV